MPDLLDRLVSRIASADCFSLFLLARGAILFSRGGLLLRCIFLVSPHLSFSSPPFESLHLADPADEKADPPARQRDEPIRPVQETILGDEDGERDAAAEYRAVCDAARSRRRVHHDVVRVYHLERVRIAQLQSLGHRRVGLPPFPEGVRLVTWVSDWLLTFIKLNVF
jgi:hypothetical protein